jgi:hypothetical protein
MAVSPIASMQLDSCGTSCSHWPPASLAQPLLVQGTRPKCDTIDEPKKPELGRHQVDQTSRLDFPGSGFSRGRGTIQRSWSPSHSRRRRLSSEVRRLIVLAERTELFNGPMRIQRAYLRISRGYSVGERVREWSTVECANFGLFPWQLLY